MIHAPRLVRSCLLVAACALAACSSDDKPKSADAGAPELGKEPVVGGKLGAAIASAAAQSTAKPKAKSQQEGDQPPENGVFAAGEADKRQPKGSPAKIDVMSDGEGNKVQLAYKLDVAELKTTISTSVRTPQGRLPPIDFALSIKPDKDKDKAKDAGAKPADKPGDKPKDAAPAGDTPVVHLVATVTGATLSAAQGIPKEVVDEIAKLKGSTIRYDLSASGNASGFVVTLGKDGQGLEPLVDSLSTAISLLTVPLPPKPVGIGAYWIAAERAEADAGIDVVRFRVFKVLKIEGDSVTLSSDVRQYSADQSMKLPDQGGGVQEMSLTGFDSKGTGAVVWKADSFVAVKGDATQDTQAQLVPPGAAQQPQPGQQRAGGVMQRQLTVSVGGGTGTAPPPPKR